MGARLQLCRHDRECRCAPCQGKEEGRSQEGTRVSVKGDVRTGNRSLCPPAAGTSYRAWGLRARPLGGAKCCCLVWEALTLLPGRGHPTGPFVLGCAGADLTFLCRIWGVYVDTPTSPQPAALCVQMICPKLPPPSPRPLPGHQSHHHALRPPPPHWDHGWTQEHLGGRKLWSTTHKLPSPSERPPPWGHPPQECILPLRPHPHPSPVPTDGKVLSLAQTSLGFPAPQLSSV